VTLALDEIVNSTLDLSAARILRVFRMVRVLRIIRIVGPLCELREMLCSLIAALKSMCWSLLLLSLVLYLFAVLFMQGALDAITQDGAQPEQFQGCWGSLGGAMYTLLAAISGGQDWMECVNLFDPYSLWYRAIFSFYIVFVTFGMLNVLTGIFVARAGETSVLDKDVRIQAEIANTKSVVKDLQTLFKDADSEQHGSIDIERLTEYTSRPDVQAYFNSLQLHTANFKELVSMLDPQRTGKVSMNEFIAGCLRYKGSARTVDVAMLLKQQRQQSERMKQLTKNLESHLMIISQKIQVLAHPGTKRVRYKRRTRSSSCGSGEFEEVPHLDQPLHGAVSGRSSKSGCVDFEDETKTVVHNAASSEQPNSPQDFSNVPACVNSGQKTLRTL